MNENIRMCGTDPVTIFRYNFDTDSGGCSGAGVTGCGSATSNKEIPDEAKIPGTPNHTDDVQSSDPAYAAGIVSVRAGSLVKAASICKLDCCKQVKIYYFSAPKNDKLEDALYQHKKPMIEIYDCKKSRIIKVENNYFLDDRSKEGK